LDEKGMLCWFLSLPKDWQIRPAHVCKEHDIGRDKFHRIMKSLRAAGYSKMEVERAEDGTIICFRHRISESPKFLEEGPAAVEIEEIEAGDDVNPESDFPEVDEPCPPQPVTAQPVTENPSKDKVKSLQNTDSTKAAAPIWRDLRARWPASEILSPVACERLFALLSQEDKQQAIEGVRAYLERCKERNRKVCDLSTYLKERRFETVTIETTNGTAIVQPGTPQAARWLEGDKLTAFQRHRLTHGQPITIKSETGWPPAAPKQESTGPPLSPLMTPEDEDELRKWG
jgi:hypothetical protein